MSAQQGLTDPTNSEPATSASPDPAPVTRLHKLVLGIFTAAMIVAVSLGVVVVAGQIAGIVLGSSGVVTFFADYPSKVAFFAAGVVCVASLVDHYFPGAAAQESDDH